MSDFYGVSTKLLEFCIEEGCSLDGEYYRDDQIMWNVAPHVKPSWVN